MNLKFSFIFHYKCAQRNTKSINIIDHTLPITNYVLSAVISIKKIKWTRTPLSTPYISLCVYFVAKNRCTLALHRPTQIEIYYVARVRCSNDSFLFYFIVRVFFATTINRCSHIRLFIVNILYYTTASQFQSRTRSGG